MESSSSQRPAISIVIPTRNEESYIGQTIEQFRDFLERYNLEIIISDADSHDKTADIVAGYQAEWGERVKWVLTTGPQNIAMGRNAGARVAQGDILFHMDADVRIPDIPHFFDAVLRKFQSEKIVAAAARLWVYPEESRLSDKIYHVLMNTLIWFSFQVHVPLSKGECQLVRRSAFEAVDGYNEKLVAGEDCNLFYRLQKVGSIKFLHHLYVYHSPRRFRKYGYIGVTMIYLREGLSMVFRGKSWVSEWTVVR